MTHSPSPDPAPELPPLSASEIATRIMVLNKEAQDHRFMAQSHMDKANQKTGAIEALNHVLQRLPADKPAADDSPKDQ